jgi:ABC-type polysaccharide/polyol phosphate transport system ATPase subunit
MERTEDNQVVDIRNLTKTYNLYSKPIDRLKETFNPLGKKYHTTVNSLQDVTFSVSKGDILGIIGKNGSGKSTLLKIIAGVLTPTSGTIEIKGRISSILELGTGFNPEFTGIENIYHMGLLMGYSEEQMDKKIHYVKKFADIGDFIDQPVKIYSSGMYVRLAFAIAINVEPDILIADEVLAVGDINFQAKCMSKFKQLIERGVTVLIVTHDTNTVKELCNKCLYLKRGEAVAFGITQDAVDLYLHDMRNEMNADLLAQTDRVTPEMSFPGSISEDKSTNPRFKTNAQFTKRTELFRQGTGEAKIVNVEILDSLGKLLTSVEFNEKVTIRIHILFEKDASVAVCYHIRDFNNIELVGSDTLVENYGRINGKSNQKFIVDFTTRLSLIEGIYNLLVLLSNPVLMNRNAIFIDWAENAYTFQVYERNPMKIWDKVYLENGLAVYQIE